MSHENEQDDAPKQTTPKGLEIPIPTREEFLRNMEKVAPPPKPPEAERERSEDRGADE